MILRAVRLLVEGGRSVGRTGLGAANVLFLELLLEDLRRREATDQIASWMIAVEEPEAHLHPHVQRVIFRTILRSGRGVILTTHSPQVVSVSPVEAILLLQGTGNGTVATYSGSAGLSPTESEDLERYLDAVRADFVFAKGVMIVEGASELWIAPAASLVLGHDLDRLGITVTPAHGTSFAAYRKFLGGSGLSVPNVVVTDGDPDEDTGVLTGIARGVRLLSLAGRASAEQAISVGDADTLRDLLASEGVFVGNTTLEVDIAAQDADIVMRTFEEIVESTLRRDRFRSALDRLGPNPTHETADPVLRAIERIGKGRFAQRLATHLRTQSIPRYLENAITAVVERARG
jgi:putative ATP-dependent endonuclease of OLD family